MCLREGGEGRNIEEMKEEVGEIVVWREEKEWKERDTKEEKWREKEEKIKKEKYKRRKKGKGWKRVK